MIRPARPLYDTTTVEGTGRLVQVRLEPDLLRLLDRFAQGLNVSRSEGLHRFLDIELREGLGTWKYVRTHYHDPPATDYVSTYKATRLT